MTALYDRRILSEWELLLQLAARNPGRLQNPQRNRGTFYLRLHGPSANVLCPGQPSCPMVEHDLRIEYPVHFPAVPMEMFLARAAVHPNIHPETGFVCLWQTHRAQHTVEHALHRLAAMLAGQLQNPDAVHVMQPDALPMPAGLAMPLLGVLHDAPPLPPRSASRRLRLQ